MKDSGVIVVDGDDLVVFDNTSDALEWMEPIDVQQESTEVLDAEANYFRPIVEGEKIGLLPEELDAKMEEDVVIRMARFARSSFPSSYVPTDLLGLCRFIIHEHRRLGRLG